MKDSERNERGKEYESLGEIEKAIELYEQNITLGTKTPFPYNRLVVLYNKGKDLSNEIRILKLLLSLQENEAKKFNWKEGSKQFDKIIKTRNRLSKALSEKR